MNLRMFSGTFSKDGIGSFASSLFAQLPEGKVHKKVMSGSREGATNNEMELVSVLESLKAIKPSVRGQVKIYVETRNRYTVSVFNDWMQGWKENGWKKKDKAEIKHLELIKEIDALASEFEMVKIAYASSKDNKFLLEAAESARSVCEANKA